MEMASKAKPMNKSQNASIGSRVKVPSLLNKASTPITTEIQKVMSLGRVSLIFMIFLLNVIGGLYLNESLNHYILNTPKL